MSNRIKEAYEKLKAIQERICDYTFTFYIEEVNKYSENGSETIQSIKSPMVKRAKYYDTMTEDLLNELDVSGVKVVGNYTNEYIVPIERCNSDNIEMVGILELFYKESKQIGTVEAMDEFMTFVTVFYHFVAESGIVLRDINKHPCDFPDMSKQDNDYLAWLYRGLDEYYYWLLNDEAEDNENGCDNLEYDDFECFNNANCINSQYHIAKYYQLLILYHKKGGNFSSKENNEDVTSFMAGFNLLPLTYREYITNNNIGLPTLFEYDFNNNIIINTFNSKLILQTYRLNRLYPQKPDLSELVLFGGYTGDDPEYDKVRHLVLHACDYWINQIKNITDQDIAFNKVFNPFGSYVSKIRFEQMLTDIKNKFHSKPYDRPEKIYYDSMLIMRELHDIDTVSGLNGYLRNPDPRFLQHLQRHSNRYPFHEMLKLYRNWTSHTSCPKFPSELDADQFILLFCISLRSYFEYTESNNTYDNSNNFRNLYDYEQESDSFILTENIEINSIQFDAKYREIWNKLNNNLSTPYNQPSITSYGCFRYTIDGLLYTNGKIPGVQIDINDLFMLPLAPYITYQSGKFGFSRTQNPTPIMRFCWYLLTK